MCASMILSAKIPENPGHCGVFPESDREEYEECTEWAVKDLGFKGLKLHTAAFCCSPMAPQAEKIFEAAARLHVPVMIHTGAGLPNALPSLSIPMARKYPGLKIVLAHAGGGMFGQDALVSRDGMP